MGAGTIADQAVRTVTSRRISVRQARALRKALEGDLARQRSVSDVEILIAQACHAIAGQRRPEGGQRLGPRQAGWLYRILRTRVLDGFP